MSNVDAITIRIANLFRYELDHCRDWRVDR